MKSALIKDYLFRAEKRIKMLEFLKQEKDYADVVREAQEVVELLLKALILAVGLEIPKVHDVSMFQFF
jgi:HEPN domain-containing protein